MSEPTDQTQPTPPVPPDAAGEAAAPPPPPAGTWSAAAPADPPPTPPAPASTPTIGRNLAIGIAMAALVIGGLLGALVTAVVVDDHGSTRPIGFDDRRGAAMDGAAEGQGQMGPMRPGDGQGRMRPRGVDPDGDGWTGGRGPSDQAPDGTTPSTPSTPTTTPASSGA